MKHRYLNQLWEEIVGLTYPSTSESIIGGSQDRNTRWAGAGTDAEATEGAAYWLAPQGLLNLPSYRSQDHSHRADPTHYELGPPSSITPKLDLMEAFSQLRLPPPQ